jgi:crotonobetainyl-CoA:carnitine CoA-transferase CaiB-like acyl-CoA transferase
MGAEIVKIEPPGQPDQLRDWGKARYEGRSLWWPVQSRNKRCCTLDLRKEKGQELLLELVKHADVLVENFRPGTLERWNIGPDRLHEANPGLVIARVSGYGQTGPYAARAGFASVAEAMGGIRYINGFPGEAPPRMHISLGDSLAGMYAVQGILAALYRRDALRGEGQVVDVSLLESCFSLLESTVPEYDRLGVVRGPGGTGLQGVAPSNIFKSSDGKWMVIAANADTVFRRLCEAMRQPELAADARYVNHQARGAHQQELDELIGRWTAGQTTAEVLDLMDRSGVPAGQIYRAPEMLADPHFAAREAIVDVPHPQFGRIRMQNVVPKLSATPGGVRAPSPALGEHNDAIYLDMLGLPRERYESLKAARVI